MSEILDEPNYLELNNDPPEYVYYSADHYDFDNLTADELKELEWLLELQLADGLDNIQLYEWQCKFIRATESYRQCLLMAANRVGKTYTGCYLDAVHATGRYPPGWEGYKFDHAPIIWCLGYSGMKCRDILQMALFGAYANGEFSGGLVSKEYIVGAISGGTTKLADEVHIIWKGENDKEGITRLQFKSYSMGQHALMGDDIDWYHIDEEPKDTTIWPQILTRTASGDNGRGGRGILTFTPENGKTELVTQFMDDIGPGQYLQTATWNEAPHLSEEIKREILAAYPPYQRKMRSEGHPLMGSGLIYEHSEDDLSIAPFKPPDYWFIINGQDFGWDHPQACVQLVEDRDSGIIYFTNAWKGSKKHPYEAWHIVKPWHEGIPTAWPHDGLKGQLKTSEGRSNDGDTIKDLYIEEGFWMLDEHATWEDGGNSVQRGIMEFNNLMAAGKIKIFSNLFALFEEIRQYHTKTSPGGQTEIVKLGDDLLDACRYAYMMRRYAVRICDLKPPDKNIVTNPHEDGRDNVTGY